MNIHNKLLQHLSSVKSTDELARGAGNFIAQEQPALPFAIVKFQLQWPPLKIIFSSNLNLSQESVISLEQLNLPTPLNVFTVPRNSGENSFYLFVSNEIDEEVKELLELWQNAAQMFKNFEQDFKQETHNYFANLIAQYIHDVESLSTLVRKEGPDAPVLKQKLEYQQRVNQNLLYFVRDLELLTTRVKIHDLINASLEKNNWLALKQNIDFSGLKHIHELEVDVELFDRAFSEVLQNSLKAVDDDPQKIVICFEELTVNLHFSLKHWLVVTIIDRGKGINPDFLPWITEPYFTTWKQEGHTGFGLSITQKILAAHGGFLHIAPAREGGTIVKLFWPVNRNEQNTTK